MSATAFELGLNSFGEVATDGGRPLSDAETVRLLIEEARLAEAVGIDAFSVGEHYRAGHNDSATQSCSPRSPPRRNASGSALR
ncbi:hypothetical protein OHA27_12870 [Streptomyces sp. NBC_01619]|uniref:hypothetical protein n=1 Tax=Streptomyces sp. NBC_01619 TaxID=2975901 RepID=UPI00224D01FE|nr:hypothetical protein [Streptomyces sp. NBC_01619]MCX4511183.1 hypothetical protein [Streptomyces sp. NBC_01619]